MKKKMIFACAIIAIVSIAGLSACQELAKLNGKRDVVDNVFTSSSISEAAFKINPEFQFLGKTVPTSTIALRQKEQIASLERESFIFVSAKNGNAVEKGVIIRTYNITGDPNYWPEDIMRGKVPCLQSGAVKILGEEYNYCTMVVPDVLFDYEKRSHTRKREVIAQVHPCEGLGKTFGVRQ